MFSRSGPFGDDPSQISAEATKGGASGSPPSGVGVEQARWQAEPHLDPTTI